VACSDSATSPSEAETEALKMYESVDGDGVANGKFGSVVAIVAEAEDR
jgi:hypothetical protein